MKLLTPDITTLVNPQGSRFLQGLLSGGIIQAVDPSFTLGQQTTEGAVHSIEVLGFQYAGNDDLDLYAATGDTLGFAITEAELIAGAGGEGVEFATAVGYDGTEIDLTGFEDEDVVQLAIVVVEQNNGGSSGVIRVAIDVSTAVPAALTYLNTYNNAGNVGAGGTQSFPATIPGAGTFLVGLATIDDDGSSNFIVDVTGAVTAAAELVASGSKAGIKWFYIAADDAGDIQIRNTGTGAGFDQQLATYQAVGLTATGSVAAVDTGPRGQAPADVTIQVEDGDWVAAMTLFRGGSITNHTWSAGITEDFDQQQASSSHRVSAASGLQSADGSLNVSPAITGGSSGDFGLAVIALKEAG